MRTRILGKSPQGWLRSWCCCLWPRKSLDSTSLSEFNNLLLSTNQVRHNPGCWTLEDLEPSVLSLLSAASSSSPYHCPFLRLTFGPHSPIPKRKFPCWQNAGMARGKDNNTRCCVVLTGGESTEMMEVSRQASNLVARPQPRAESQACRAEHTEELLPQKRIRSVNSNHSLGAKHLKCIIPCSPS